MELEILERETRFELATPTLARLCSTTELFPQQMKLWYFLKLMSHGAQSRNRTGTPVKARDFKSLASTNFAIWADDMQNIPLSVEARPGIEPGLTDLQSATSPLCHPAIKTYQTKVLIWSGKRDSNSRPQPWQGCALPLSYSRNSKTWYKFVLYYAST